MTERTANRLAMDARAGSPRPPGAAPLAVVDL
jgi:hypothetical protein